MKSHAPTSAEREAQQERACEIIKQLDALYNSKRPGGGVHGQVIGMEPWTIRTTGDGLQCLSDAQFLLDELLDPLNRRAAMQTAEPSSSVQKRLIAYATLVEAKDGQIAHLKAMLAKQAAPDRAPSIAPLSPELSAVGPEVAPQAPEVAPSIAPVLDRQVADWRKEVARLQDLIDTATGAPSIAPVKQGGAHRAMMAAGFVSEYTKSTGVHTYTGHIEDAERLLASAPSIDSAAIEANPVAYVNRFELDHTKATGAALPASGTMFGNRTVPLYEQGIDSVADAKDALIDPVVEAVRTALLKRSQLGIKKYGDTLHNMDYSEREILQHAIEESMDLSNYLMARIMKIDEQTPAQCRCGKCDWRDFYTGSQITHSICAQCNDMIPSDHWKAPRATRPEPAIAALQPEGE